MPGSCGTKYIVNRDLQALTKDTSEAEPSLGSQILIGLHNITIQLRIPFSIIWNDGAEFEVISCKPQQCIDLVPRISRFGVAKTLQESVQLRGTHFHAVSLSHDTKRYTVQNLALSPQHSSITKTIEVVEDTLQDIPWHPCGPTEELYLRGQEKLLQDPCAIPVISGQKSCK